MVIFSFWGSSVNVMPKTLCSWCWASSKMYLNCRPVLGAMTAYLFISEIFKNVYNPPLKSASQLTKHIPFALISVRLIGFLEYSDARANLTSFFTICPWLSAPPVISPSGSSSLKFSSSDEARSGSGPETRRRVGVGEGEASTCCCF